MDAPIIYRKRCGVLRNPAIRAEIAALDAQRDCQRIVHLLVSYEFPFDIARALELALFHTYGSVRVSRRLDATGEFRKFGQKRYDDTRLLISHFLEAGYDSAVGQQAIARMNAIHGQFSIPNDDFLFVLSTFITYPIQWVERYGYRPFTPHERQAWFRFFHTLGTRMGIRSIPDSWAEFQNWVRHYEAEHLVYADSNRNVANATLAIFEAWVPWPLNTLVQLVVSALIEKKLRRAFGYATPSPVFCGFLAGVLWLRKQAKRVIHLERHPRQIANTRNRTYPGNTYTIDGIAPSYQQEAERRNRQLE